MATVVVRANKRELSIIIFVRMYISFLTGCGKTILACENFVGPHVWHNRNTFPQDAQKGCPARPQRVKGRSVPSGAHGATNKEHHVCARRRVGETAGSPLRV
jgi:hypothetical protein